MEFKVDLIKFWKHRTIFMSLLFSIAIVIVFALQFLTTGMSIEKTFQNITIAQVPLLFIAAICLASIGGLVVTIPYWFESITVLDESFIGRDSWNFRKKLPYSSIENIDRVSRIAHEQVLVDCGKDGKVHISTHIENLEMLISAIEARSKEQSTDNV